MTSIGVGCAQWAERCQVPVVETSGGIDKVGVQLSWLATSYSTSSNIDYSVLARNGSDMYNGLTSSSDDEKRYLVIGVENRDAESEVVEVTPRQTAGIWRGGYAGNPPGFSALSLGVLGAF